jgi:hypothetical protein
LVKIEDAEERAKECFLPLMLVRRHATVIMGNAKDGALKCLEEAGKEGSEPAKVRCLQGYKEELKKNAPKVQAMYDGYLQNYSAKDGSLIQGSLSKEKKVIAEL